jgi:hypothetical protein
MRIKLTLFGLILIATRVFGQLQVDAGNDTTLCLGSWGIDTTEIGGNPTASGGVEPYSFEWSTIYTIGFLSFRASYFLDDSTKSNPRLINAPLDNMDILKFNLLVTDDVGTKAKDSLRIRFSKFGYLTMDCIAFINQGDTINLFGNMGLGIEPLSFFWSPNYNISDTLTASPKAWPNTTTYYYCYAIDSIGCISDTSSCWISVFPMGINSTTNNLSNSSVFPNPINANSTISIENLNANNLSIQIVNAIGQVVLVDVFSTNTFLIGDKIFTPGIYNYVITNKAEIVSYGRFVKE